MKAFAAIAIALVLPGCASMINGTHDNIAVATDPPGATCTMDRRGERLGEVAATPGTVRVSKSRHPIEVTCARPNHQTARATVPSKENMVIALCCTGLADLATGAANDYPKDVSLTLTPNTGAQRPSQPRPPLRPREPGV